MNLQSNQVTVHKTEQELYDFLTDLKNFEQLMPENISKFELINDNAFVFALKGMPEIALELKEKEAPHKIVLGAINDKIPFTLSTQIASIDQTSAQAQLYFEGTFNAMMAMMIKGPISKFLESLTTNLARL